ncbi:hypothetical protein H9P43_002056 [Blastocladiella emersonii ATCC 22665]|nr:hypothetical protein H9P43_002056 [Blastocladiella emersonii ATCC 22665]
MSAFSAAHAHARPRGGTANSATALLRSHSASTLAPLHLLHAPASPALLPHRSSVPSSPRDFPMLPSPLASTLPTPPSLTTADSDDDDPDASSPAVPTRRLSPLRLTALTLVLLGLQLTWAIELAYGTPYLLSLGMDKAWTSLVWLAGPVSGLLVQPVVGALSDRCTLPWGRRRPFIVAGTAVVLFAMAVVAFSRPLGGTPNPTVIPEAPKLPDLPANDGVHPLAAHLADAAQQHQHGPVKATGLTIAIAVFGFYLMDFAINTVQAASRALIVDVVPLPQQATANAAASAMVCMGNVIGYAAGFVDWPATFGLVHGANPAAQLQLVCAMAGVAFVITVAITTASISEVPHRNGDGAEDGTSTVQSVAQSVRDVVAAVARLPRSIAQICTIQVLCWLGWFPFLFYSSTFVAEFATNSHTPFDGAQADRAARTGSRAFFAFSLVALLVASLLPGLLAHLRPHRAVSLASVWWTGELAFAAAMAATLAISSTAGAILVVASAGYSWAVGTWVPMALIGEALVAADPATAASEERIVDPAAVRPRPHRRRHGGGRPKFHRRGQHRETYVALPLEETPNASPRLAPIDPLPASGSSATLFAPSAAVAPVPTRSKSMADLDAAAAADAAGWSSGFESEDPDTPVTVADPSPATAMPSAGVILGLHNVAVVIPQLVVSVVASILFAVLPDGKDTPMVSGAADDAIGWLFRLGGVAAVAASVMIRRWLM